MSIYSIECYDEKEFSTKYKSVHQEILKQANKLGIDLLKYYFSQYMKMGDCEEVTYNNVDNENISFDVQWYKGNLESVSVEMD